jgi:hypothetical protein
VLLAAFTVALSLVHFQSPSGNINCIGAPPGSFGPAFVDCLVRKHTWPARITPRKPASCDVDFDPYTVSLGHRKVSVGSCRGDIGPLCVYTSDKCSTLGYGRSVSIGPIRCTSATAGVTCRYTTSPRVGFKIAREGYVTYRS